MLYGYKKNSVLYNIQLFLRTPIAIGINISSVTGKKIKTHPKTALPKKS